MPHLIPRSHVERARGPWVGAWAQPPAYVRKQVPTQVCSLPPQSCSLLPSPSSPCFFHCVLTLAVVQVFVQTPAEEEWEEVDQPEWERPGLAFA